MSSEQQKEKFDFTVKYLFEYFKQRNFRILTTISTADVDTLLVASHHNQREFSIDYYYNNIRIQTNIKKYANQLILKMENMEINFYAKVVLDLIHKQNNIDKSLNDLIGELNICINTHIPKQMNTNPSQSLHTQHVNTNPRRHTKDPSNCMPPPSGPQLSLDLSLPNHSMDLNIKTILHSGIQTTNDMILGMRSPQLSPHDDMNRSIPPTFYERGGAGLGDPYTRLPPDYPQSQSISEDRDKIQMKRVEGGYDGMYGQQTTSYCTKSTSSLTSNIVSAAEGVGAGPYDNSLEDVINIQRRQPLFNDPEYVAILNDIKTSTFK